MFFDFLMVTRMMSGTWRMPSFCMALRLFFSQRLWRPPPKPSPCTRQHSRATHSVTTTRFSSKQAARHAHTARTTHAAHPDILSIVSFVLVVAVGDPNLASNPPI